MLIKLTVPGNVISPEIIGRAMEASSLTTEASILADALPSIYDAIRSGSVVWKAEPAGQGYESFDLPHEMLKRGWGDCDDLAPWLAAELRATGVDPDAWPIAYESAPNRYHAVVLRSDGSIDDPSRWAGMKNAKQAANAPAEKPLVNVGESALQMSTPYEGCYVCRIDLACSHCEPQGLSVRSASSSPIGAVEQAAEQAFRICISANLDPKTVRQVYGLLAALHGHSMADIEEVTGLDAFRIGGLVPQVAMAVELGHDVYPEIGDGILSTIFDPLGIHHVFDPLLQTAMQQAQAPSRPGQVTYAPAPGVMEALKAIIGQSVGACATQAQLAAMSPHQRLFSTPCKTKAKGPAGRGSRAPGAQHSGTPNTSSRGASSSTPGATRPAAVDPSTRQGAQRQAGPERGSIRQQAYQAAMQDFQDNAADDYSDDDFDTFSDDDDE